jgi:hypothetical protein
MRLWSLHPRFLDARGLVACWREALLAQKVLAGETVGYTRHPQLERFRASADPHAAIARFLTALADEADARGYRFDRSRIRTAASRGSIRVTSGQLAYELALLRRKIQTRDPAWLESSAWAGFVLSCSGTSLPATNDAFSTVSGEIEPWERVKSLE